MAPSIQIATKFAKLGKAPLKWPPPKSIEPKNFGWIRPDGKISFESEQAASEYTKNRIMQALHSEKPFERAIFQKNNLILADIDGGAHNVHFDSKKILCGHKNVTLTHGHPTNTPLSDQDYSCLVVNDNLKSVIAYNKRGEFSKMTKQEPFILRLLPKNIYEYLKCSRIISAKMKFEEFVKTDFKELIRRIKELQNVCNGMSKEEMLSTLEGQKVTDFAKQVLNKMNNIWAKNERMFGIKYETDFSKLT